MGLSIHKLPPDFAKNRPELADENLVNILVEAIMNKKRGESVDKRGIVGLALMGILVLSAYLIPYTVLTDVPKWYGSGLYWVLFALAAIFVMAWLTAEWRE